MASTGLDRGSVGIGRSHHPLNRDRLRWVFAKVGIAGLIALFVLLLVSAAALLAVFLMLDSSRSQVGFLVLWKEELMTIISLPTKTPAANRGSGLSQAVAIAAGLLALILPALYIGAVVFRLFIHPKVFVFRKKIALLPSPDTFKGELDDDGHVLAIRTYSASRMKALDVQFRVVHQHWFEGPKGSVVRNFDVDLANPDWPMADRHVPYTLFVELWPDDVAEEGGHLHLRAIEGRFFHAKDRLVVHVLGTMPELGETFVERHAFELSKCVSDDEYGGIEIEYGSDSKAWSGWRGFDG